MRRIFEASRCVPIECEECGKELGMCEPNTFAPNIFDLCFECFDKLKKHEYEMWEAEKRGRRLGSILGRDTRGGR